MHSVTLPRVNYRGLAAPTLKKCAGGLSFQPCRQKSPFHFSPTAFEMQSLPADSYNKMLNICLDDCIQTLHFEICKLDVVINGRVG